MKMKLETKKMVQWEHLNWLSNILIEKVIPQFFKLIRSWLSFVTLSHINYVAWTVSVGIINCTYIAGIGRKKYPPLVNFMIHILTNSGPIMELIVVK